NAKAVAFLASWRLRSVPELKQRANRQGFLAPWRPRVANAVAVLRELRATSWTTAYAVGFCSSSLMVRVSTRRNEGAKGWLLVVQFPQSGEGINAWAPGSATAAVYPLALHDALPLSTQRPWRSLHPCVYTRSLNRNSVRIT